MFYEWETLKKAEYRVLGNKTPEGAPLPQPAEGEDPGYSWSSGETDHAQDRAGAISPPPLRGLPEAGLGLPATGPFGIPLGGGREQPKTQVPWTLRDFKDLGGEAAGTSSYSKLPKVDRLQLIGEKHPGLNIGVPEMNRYEGRRRIARLEGEDPTKVTTPDPETGETLYEDELTPWQTLQRRVKEVKDARKRIAGGARDELREQRASEQSKIDERYGTQSATHKDLNRRISHQQKELREMVREGQVLGPNWGKHAGKDPRELLRNRGEPFVLHTQEGAVPSGVGGRKGPLGARIKDRIDVITDAMGRAIHPWSKQERKYANMRAKAVGNAVTDYAAHKAWNPNWEMPKGQARIWNNFVKDVLVDRGVDETLAGQMARGTLSKKIADALAYKKDFSQKVIKDIIGEEKKAWEAEAKAAGASGPGGYKANTIAQNRKICRERGLRLGGSAAEIIARLTENDEKNEEAEAEAEETIEDDAVEVFPDDEWNASEGYHDADAEDYWAGEIGKVDPPSWEELGSGPTPWFGQKAQDTFMARLPHYRKEFSFDAKEHMRQLVKTKTAGEFVASLVTQSQFGTIGPGYTNSHVKVWANLLDQGLPDKGMYEIIRYVTNGKYEPTSFKKPKEKKEVGEVTSNPEAFDLAFDDPKEVAWAVLKSR